MKLTRLFFAAAVATLFVSCNNDDDSGNTPAGSYDKGTLVVNEGNGTAGSITYFGSDMVMLYEDIYSTVNPGDGIGGYVQSLFFNGDNAYIISNGSNKITVVNRYTFKLIAKIEDGFSVPRYGVVDNGKAYVTNLGSFSDLTDDFVSVIDLATNTVTATYPVGAIADHVVEKGGKLYIANGNYGDGHSVTVMKASTGEKLATIETTLSPSSLTEDSGILYVLCGNYGTAGKLLRINVANNAVVGTVDFPAELTNPQNLVLEDNKLYFTVDSKVYTLSQDATSISATPLFTSEAVTLYGFNVHDDLIYVADAKDYASDGKAYIYTLDGTFKKQFTTGLNPNGFYFND